LVFHNDAYSGGYASTVLTPKVKKEEKNLVKVLQANTLILVTPLKPLYEERQLIKAAKFNDLQYLKKFVIKNESCVFYENLKISDIIENSDDKYSD